MENSHRFYRNTHCEYFPCHNVKNEGILTACSAIVPYTF